MKAVGILMAGLVTGSFIGWYLGFLRLPYVELTQSFLFGFIACLILILFIFILFFAWNKNANLLRLINEVPAQHTKSAVRIYFTIWMLVAVSIVAGGLLNGFLIYKQSKFFKTELRKQSHKMLEQSVLIESGRKSNTIFLMSSILDKVEDEIESTGMLSDAIIARIAALSFSCKPYRYLEGDSLSAKEYSPERGQLLLALILMKMDSGSFSKIKRHAPFAGADMKGANLRNADLSGANLSGANLSYADLSDANLRHAKMNDVNLWGTDLTRANLSGADLKRSDLRWAKLNATNMKLSNLNGAQLSNAQLIRANAQEASMQYADLDGALLNEAILSGVNFIGTAMSRINLDSADLRRTDLRMTNLQEANLSGTDLNKAVVDSNWVDKLRDWRLTGIKEIREGYLVVKDSLDQWKNPIYRLKKIE